MENEILFSIIVPVYNTEKYITKCLKSIKDAIDLDCEVIIINDGSTDNSEKLIKEFIEQLPNEYKNNFKYKYKENKGLADTKNVGISMANGQYISVIDSDDYISDDFYEIARKYIKTGYEIIIYDLYVIFENEKFVNYVARASRDDKKDFKTSIITGAMQGSSCNKIIKSSLYKPYKFPTNKQYEDTAVTPFILMDTEKIKYVPYPLYYYVQREKSIVATNTLISAFYKICENISNELKNRKNFEKYNKIINEFFIERFLKTLTDDYRENRKEFGERIEHFREDNLDTINYILESNMIFNVENMYTDRQKTMVQQIYNNIKEKKYDEVKKIIFARRAVNFIRDKIGKIKTVNRSI